MRTALALIGLLLWSVPLSAQTTLKIQWSQDPAAVSYNLTTDGALMNVPNALSVSCNCIEVQKAFAAGAHTLILTALFPSLSCEPSTSFDSGTLIESPPVMVTFTLNPGSQIKNVKITK